MESENRYCLLTCLSPTLIIQVKSQGCSLSSVHAGIQMSHNAKLCSLCGVWEGPVTGPLHLGSGGRERWQPTWVDHGEPTSSTLSLFALIATPCGRVLLSSQFVDEKSESRGTVYLLKHRQLLYSVWDLRLTEVTLLNCYDIKCKLKMFASKMRLCFLINASKEDCYNF